METKQRVTKDYFVEACESGQVTVLDLANEDSGTCSATFEQFVPLDVHALRGMHSEACTAQRDETVSIDSTTGVAQQRGRREKDGDGCVCVRVRARARVRMPVLVRMEQLVGVHRCLCMHRHESK